MAPLGSLTSNTTLAFMYPPVPLHPTAHMYCSGCPGYLRVAMIFFLTLKNIDLDTKIIILSALVRKLWSKTSFCIMVDNVTCLHMSLIQTTQAILCNTPIPLQQECTTNPQCRPLFPNRKGS